jgi:transcriptional regulator with XRE-family HTH domain
MRVMSEAPPVRAEEVLGRRVRDYRTAKMWSQEDLAEKMSELGFSWNQSIVTRTESATRPIRVDEAVALAGLFEVGVEDLISEKGSNPLAARYKALVLRRGALHREFNTAKTKTLEIGKEIETVNRQLESLGTLGASLNSGEATLEDVVKLFAEEFGAGEAQALLLSGIQKPGWSST